MSIQIGRIYKVQHLDSSLCYIGSTCNTVRDRWRSHKRAFVQWVKDKQKYSTIALYPYLEQYGIDRFQMMLIKEYQIVDKNQLRVFEQLAINRTKSCCNQNAAIQIINTASMAKHYHQANKQAISEKGREYYQANKQAFNEKCREYRQVNKQAISEKSHEYRQANKQAISEKSHEYRQANKQAISEKCREYYQVNKQAIKEKATIKVECDCGTMIRKSDIARHQKSTKHTKLLATLTQ